MGGIKLMSSRSSSDLFVLNDSLTKGVGVPVGAMLLALGAELKVLGQLKEMLFYGSPPWGSHLIYVGLTAIKNIIEECKPEIR